VQQTAADTAASTVKSPRCICYRDIVNVLRAEAAIASRRKEGRSRSNPPEEIRARRIGRFVLLGAVIACVLGVAIYFGARPVGGAIKAGNRVASRARPGHRARKMERR
jgi:hypothetical protein